MTDESPESHPKDSAMGDGCIRAMYPELTPAQRAVLARLSGQFEEVKDLLARICEQAVPELCEDVEDDALCGPTGDLLQGVRDYIDWYASEFLEGDDDDGPEHSGDVEDEVLEEVDLAGAGASSATGQGPGTFETGTTAAASPAPAPWSEKLRQLRVDQLARAAREKPGPPVTPSGGPAPPLHDRPPLDRRARSERLTRLFAIPASSAPGRGRTRD